MAGVFVEWAGGPAHGDFAGPGFGECRRVVDRETVLQGIRTGAGEALDYVQVGVRSAEGGLAGKVGGIDYESVAVPMADRVAHPQAHRGGEVGPAIERDDSRIMDHLDVDRDIV